MKNFFIISTFILVIITTTIIGYSIINTGEKVSELEDILTLQTNKEVYLTPYGYTLDNPNVILDPYGISPLTALILFETDEYLPVTITTQGKDKNSTYTNTFDSTKRHYIPIYGLYPDSINYINIECGEQTKTIEIKTKPLPKELLDINPILNDTNNLTFITSNNYPYAIDNNNEIRWYLTKKYSKQISYLENGHLLLSDETIDANTNSNNLVEIDLLGKIYKKYILNTPYLGTYTETKNSLLIESTNSIEIDKQTGTILKNNTKKEQTGEVYVLKSKTLNQTYQNLLPLYNSSTNYSLTKGLTINLAEETKESTNNIFLVGYIKPDKNYTNYNIEITKTNDNLQIIGNFTNKEKVYLILDKFLDKKVYDINTNYTIINSQGLSGKYSIYISIDDTIYKTNNYIKF